MIALALLAAVLLAVTLWWIARPLRTAPTTASSERAELEVVRDRLLAQLRELDAERADQGIESSVARDEELRLSAELAEVLRRLETLPAAMPGTSGGTPAPGARRPAAMLAPLSVILVLAGGGLYVWQNAASLQGFVLASRHGAAAPGVPPVVFEMVARLEKRLAENPQDAVGWARLGRSYTVLQQADKARAAYARAYELAPDNVEVLAGYAWLVFSASPDGTPGLADTLYRKLNKLDPENADALWYLGLAAYQGGDPRGALRHWERLAKQIQPGTPEHAELTRVMQVARDEAAGRQRR